MKAQEDSKVKEKIIKHLLQNGIFKVNGKQLYELTSYELMKEYTVKFR
jgi:hypothetical protein